MTTWYRKDGRDGQSRRCRAAVLVLVVGVWACCPAVRTEAGTAPDSFAAEAQGLEVKSEFSHIIVTTQGRVRTLIFVDDSGMEAVESELDLDSPHRLRLPYTQYMFASYLLRPKPEEVMIVGLGGGSMVHFLKHHEPKLQVDVVEIDPIVVKIAAIYFGVSAGGKVRIFNEDAVKHLEKTKERYDVIYMDAFLKPSAETDDTGVPLRLKTVRFLKGMREKLKPGGLAVFNVHVHSGTKKTLDAIRSVFPQVYVFQVPHRLSYVVVGSTAEKRETLSELSRRGRELDRRFRTNFSFRRIVQGLTQERAKAKAR